MVLGQEGFNETGPYQQQDHPAGQGGNIRDDQPEAIPGGCAATDAQQGAAQEQPGLACQQDGWNLGCSMREQPSEQEPCLAGHDVIQCDDTQHDAVGKQQEHGPDSRRDAGRDDEE